MSDQSTIEVPRERKLEPRYCSDPNCDYCRQLREMQEQVRGRETE
jgi:hypothetical protein